VDRVARGVMVHPMRLLYLGGLGLPEVLGGWGEEVLASVTPGFRVLTAAEEVTPAEELEVLVAHLRGLMAVPAVPQISQPLLVEGEEVEEGQPVSRQEVEVEVEAEAQAMLHPAAAPATRAFHLAQSIKVVYPLQEGLATQSLWLRGVLQMLHGIRSNG
jgi:hypothetical protein